MTDNSHNTAASTGHAFWPQTSPIRPPRPWYKSQVPALLDLSMLAKMSTCDVINKVPGQFASKLLCHLHCPNMTDVEQPSPREQSQMAGWSSHRPLLQRMHDVEVARYTER